MILNQSKPLRLGMMAAFYFTQGVPNGLFLVAIPAWIVANGGGATETAAVVSSYMFFWIWKAVTALIMDRYTYLPMGRRRAWIITAQSVLTAVFVLSALISPIATDIGLLSALALAAGFGASTQDVGIDGLAVDILKEDERSIAAGLMFGSSLIGMSLSGMVAGQLIERVGISAAYAVAAITVGLVLMLGMLVLEREGERRFPWTTGEAHPRNREIQAGAWWPLLRNSVRALFTPLSIAFVICLMIKAMTAGTADSFHPVLTQGIAGWSVTEYTNTVSTFGLLSGVTAMTIGGWAIAKIGEPRAFPVLLGIFAVVSIGFASMRDLWTDDTLLLPFLFAWGLLGVLLQVTFIPIAMRLCDPSAAATQFTVYMAAANIGRTLGAGFAAGVVAAYAPEYVYYGLFCFLVVAVLIAILAPFPSKSILTVEAVEHETAQKEDQRVPDIPATP